MVLMSIFEIVNDVEQLFVCLSTICISSLEKISLKISLKILCPLENLSSFLFIRL